MPEFITLLPVILTLLAVGAVAGVLAGLLGVGGGIVLVPAFFYSFSSLGYDNAQLMQICVATSLATIVFTSIRSVSSHHKKGAVDWDILKTWAPGIMVGAIVGVLVAARLPSSVLVMVFGCLGICVGLYMAFGNKDWTLGDQMPTGGLRGMISSVIGFLSVLMGIGGGSFAVPTMTLYGIPIHRAVATAAGFGLAIAVPSAIGFLIAQPPMEGRPPFMVGYVNVGAFVVVVAMTMITAPLGASLAHRLDVKTLKRVFAIFLAIVSVNMLREVFFG